MKKYQQRQEAIRLYLQGEKVTVIARLMFKSRKWVHHWIKRYRSNSDTSNWFKDESKAPKNYPGLFWHTYQMDLVGPRYIKGN